MRHIIWSSLKCLVERENIFCHFESDLAHGDEDDFIEEQVGEDEMDRESDSEEGTIPRMDLSASDEHSEDDEPSITILQPLDMAFLSREVEGGVSIGSDNRDMSPSSSPAATSSILPSSAHSDLPNDLHGYYKSKDGNVWCKNAPEPTKTPSRNIFRPSIRQVINPRNMLTAGAAYKISSMPRWLKELQNAPTRKGRGFVVSSGDISMPQKLKGLSDVSFTWARREIIAHRLQFCGLKQRAIHWWWHALVKIVF